MPNSSSGCFAAGAIGHASLQQQSRAELILASVFRRRRSTVVRVARIVAQA